MRRALLDPADLTATPPSWPFDDLPLHTRVSAEFREMPGLMLTLPQAARLFSIDLPQCERVLSALVARGELRTDGHAFLQA